MNPTPACVSLLLTFFVSSLAAAELPVARFRPQVIDPAIQIGYGLAIADVDGDGKPDILLADAKQIVWYRAPKWEKFVMAENLTTKDNVCIAARDLDGDGKCEVAVGAEWNPGDTVGSGAVFLLDAPADRTQRWTPRKLPHEPTTHRMHWQRGADGKFSLAVLPLHGRGNKNNAGEGVRFLAYAWPWQEGGSTKPLFDRDAALHATHNFDLLADESMLVATKEGVRGVSRSGGAWVLNAVSAGEVRRGRTGRGGEFVATIEPMHGNQLAVYRAPAASTAKLPWDSSRTSLDESLIQGHGLATGDLLGVGSDQIVVGWRGAKAGDKVGIKLYAATDAAGENWKMHALIDDNQMAVEDLKIADLDGDGRPEIIAAGRATKNVIIYWNEMGQAKR
jgi:hypothetical protein